MLSWLLIQKGLLLYVIESRADRLAASRLLMCYVMVWSLMVCYRIHNMLWSGLAWYGMGWDACSGAEFRISVSVRVCATEESRQLNAFSSCSVAAESSELFFFGIRALNFVSPELKGQDRKGPFPRKNGGVRSSTLISGKEVL